MAVSGLTGRLLARLGATSPAARKASSAPAEAPPAIEAASSAEAPASPAAMAEPAPQHSALAPQTFDRNAPKGSYVDLRI